MKLKNQVWKIAFFGSKYKFKVPKTIILWGISHLVPREKKLHFWEKNTSIGQDDLKIEFRKIKIGALAH